jgi:S-phase kinase-associated protein 1
MSDFKAAEETGDDRSVHLVSGEGESFDIPLSVAKMSELVKTMITDDEEEVQEIPLPNVKSSILAKVIEFARHYKTEAMTDIEKVNFEN